MKKNIFLIIATISFFISFGQLPNNHHTSNYKTKEIFDGIISSDSGHVYNFCWPDTFSANKSAISKYNGSNIHTCDGRFWIRYNSRWILVSGSGISFTGNALIDGSASWTGVGLSYDVTIGHYIIQGVFYTSVPGLVITLDPSNPSLKRRDVIYYDFLGNIGKITGVPNNNPEKPQVNPLTQIEITDVLINPGETTPANVSKNVVYAENIEPWSHSSNITGIDFNYTSSYYAGSKSIYVPNASDGDTISFLNSADDIAGFQFLKFKIKLNSSLSGSINPFISVDFLQGGYNATQTFKVMDGVNNFNSSIINSWQTVVVKIKYPFSRQYFDRIRFTLNGSPASFNLDDITLIEGESFPEDQSTPFYVGGNNLSGVPFPWAGSKDYTDYGVMSNNNLGFVLGKDGILPSEDTTDQLLAVKTTGGVPYLRKLNQPSLYFDAPDLESYIALDGKKHVRYIGSGGGGSGWNLTGNSGTTYGTNFIGTADDVGLMFKVNNIKSGSIDQALQNTSFGYETLQSPTNSGGGSNGTHNVAIGYRPLKNITTGSFNIGIGTQALLNNTTGFSNIGIGGSSMLGNTTGQYNTAIGLYSLAGNSTGISNTAVGFYSLTGNGSSLLSCITGSHNTAIGYFAGTTATNTDTSIAIGADARASTKQFTISDYINKWKSYGLSKNGTTINQVLTDTTGNGDLTLKPINLSGYVQFSDTGSTIGTKYEQVFIKGSGTGSITTKTGGNTVTGANSSIVAGNGGSNDGLACLMASEGGIIDNLSEAGIATGFNPDISASTDFIATGTSPVLYNSNGAVAMGINPQIFDAEGGVALGNAPQVTKKSGFAVQESTSNGELAGAIMGATADADSSLALMGGLTTAKKAIAIGFGVTGDHSNTLHVDSLRVKNSINHGEWKASPIANAYIANPNITVNGQLISLGGSGTVAAAAGTLTGSTLASGVTSSSLTSFGSSIVLGTPASGNFSSGTFTWPTFNQNTTGSAASLTTARKINGVSFNGTADIAVDKRILAYQALGSTIVAENVDGQLAQVINSLAMTSQRAYFQAVYIDKDQTITGFKWKQATAGSYTANNYNGGALYSYSGGTLTLVASSTNDGNIWTASSGTIGSKAFSSTYSATAGLYFVAIIWSASATTTAPSLGTLTATSSINTVTDFTNSAKTSGLISSLTALPSPTQASSGISASANEYWIGLY